MNERLSPMWTLLLAAATGALRLLTNVAGAFNAAPVAACATFSGARLKLWQAVLVPLGVMFATDLALWWMKGDDYSPFDATRPWVYGSFLINIVIGRLLIGTSGWRQIPQIGAAALLGSVQFFLVTNFASWLDPRIGYTQDVAGLIECYVKAIPFWRLDCDLVFTFALFGIHALAVHLTRPKAPASASAQLSTDAQT